jgi:FkbM family methyltransferase
MEFCKRMISYAQNFEDVMLWRALKDIKYGVYIDVGANDPVIDSVTKIFYDQGWSGINIEPIPQWYEKLVAARPRDTNLQLAASSKAGRLSIYEVADTGLSTSIDTIAKSYKGKKFNAKLIKVEAKTLNQICTLYPHSEIHFLEERLNTVFELILPNKIG